ncbi:alpha-ketoglutarate-dependent dioxygenase AlkB family protein [Rhodococcus sp. NPDC058521]|uniref:alpha-ketoglutarate-dependent dioxygenase AlkB family protein n=1 Tax=Rhodococcus sp. NPDC058521 TaxID=3346536 RepID=UPI003668A7FC
MTTLFGDDALPRPPQEVAPGAFLVTGWLAVRQQQWIVDRFEEWASGPVPLRGAKVRGHEMSVKTVCLGWHWRPYEYTRTAVDVNGALVLPVPDWMVRLGRRALADTGHRAADSYTPDAVLVNYYDAEARMGMHQDKDEHSGAPVVSLSIGDTCRFRFGNNENRNKPYRDVALVSGDLFVFGGPARFAFHGVLGVQPGTAPAGCGLDSGRINITMRETGLT